MPAFADLLRRVSEFYRTRARTSRSRAKRCSRRSHEMHAAAAPATTPLTLAPLATAREQLARGVRCAVRRLRRARRSFRIRPISSSCCAQWRATAASDEPDLHSLYMATLTLTRMAEGGLYDQLGGGFARYSVDQYWMIPHFEKMLYDNGQLLRVYAQRGARDRR